MKSYFMKCGQLNPCRIQPRTDLPSLFQQAKFDAVGPTEASAAETLMHYKMYEDIMKENLPSELTSALGISAAQAMGVQLQRAHDMVSQSSAKDRGRKFIMHLGDQRSLVSSTCLLYAQHCTCQSQHPNLCHAG